MEDKKAKKKLVGIKRAHRDLTPEKKVKKSHLSPPKTPRDRNVASPSSERV